MPAHTSKRRKKEGRLHQDPSYPVPLEPPAPPPVVQDERPPLVIEPSEEDILSEVERELIKKRAIIEFQDSLIYLNGVYIDPETIIEMKFEEGHLPDRRVIRLTTDAGNFLKYYDAKELNEAKAKFKEIANKVVG